MARKLKPVHPREILREEFSSASKPCRGFRRLKRKGKRK